MPKITKYKEWEIEGTLEDKLLLVEAWARDGLTDKQIASNLGISEAVFYEYKGKYQEFAKSLKKGKEIVDIQVENALYKRAVGYTYIETTKELVKNPITNEYEMKITKEVTKEVQPDTTAQIYWLKNRKPNQWKDKVIDSENEEAIANAKDILVKIRKTANDRYE